MKPIDPSVAARGEIVLLVEGEGAGVRLRPVILMKPANLIIERLHVGAGKPAIRRWACKNDERALTGQRIFREELPPPPPDEPEKPVFDELVVKNLPIRAGES